MRVTIFTLACLFLGLVTARSTVEMTPELMTINALSLAFEGYKERNGKFPASWEELSRTVNLEKLNRNLRYRQSYPIQDHYEFVDKAMPFPNEEGILGEGSQVLLIRTVPLENLSEPDLSKRQQWRYLIVRLKNGETISTRLSEKAVQAMLKRAGVVITPKPGLPAVETDDIIPEREPKPQPNPNDVEFLKQHPELDPSRNGTMSTQASELVKAVSQPSVKSVTETKTSWWLILSGFIAIITSGVVAVRLMKNSPPKR